MTTSVRLALSSVSLAVALTAAPASAAPCEEAAAPAAKEQAPLACEASRPSLRRHPPPVEMTLPGYVWSKLRDEAHAYADVTAYALITATSKIAVAAAHEKAQEQPPPAAPRSPGEPSTPECGKRPRA